MYHSNNANFKKDQSKLGMVLQACKVSTQELNRKMLLKASLSYKVNFRLVWTK